MMMKVDTNGPGSGSGSVRGSGAKNSTTSAWPATSPIKSPPGSTGQQHQHQSSPSPSSSASAIAAVTHPYVENSPSPLRPIRLVAHGAKSYEPYIEEEDDDEEVGGNEGEEEGDMLADSLGGPSSHRTNHRHPQSSASVPLAPVLMRASQMTHATHATQNTTHSFATAASAAATGDTLPSDPSCHDDIVSTIIRMMHPLNHICSITPSDSLYHSQLYTHHHTSFHTHILSHTHPLTPNQSHRWGVVPLVMDRRAEGRGSRCCRCRRVRYARDLDKG